MESAEIDRELEELDEKIDKLRAQYEQYFMGIDRIEPQKPRQDVERRLKILRREQIRNTAQRFKFNMLVQRLNTMQQYWGRVVREIENGTFKRDVMRAAARFGDVALTGSGKKKLAKLVAAQAKRVVDDAMELGADDLIDDEEEDEVPTPPKFEQAASLAGIVPADLPLIQPHVPVAMAPDATYALQAPYASAQAPYPAPPVAEAVPRRITPLPPAPSSPVEAAPPSAPSRSAGLRWGSSDPSSSIRTAPVDVKRRVAELAAEMRAPRPQEGSGGGFGSLDLDFDDSPSGRHPTSPGTPPPRSAPAGRPLPAVAPPPRASSSGLRIGGPPSPQPAPPPPASGFGVLDIALDGDSGASPVPASSPSSPGSGIRMGAGRPAVAARPLGPGAASAPRTPASPPQQAGGDLAEQRMRQIYAKYVETKRSANESTAGVTYEKLAATLRAQAEKLKAQHPSRSIDYEVVVRDGKTHLKPVLK